MGLVLGLVSDKLENFWSQSQWSQSHKKGLMNISGNGSSDHLIAASTDNLVRY